MAELNKLNELNKENTLNKCVNWPHSVCTNSVFTNAESIHQQYWICMGYLLPCIHYRCHASQTEIVPEACPSGKAVLHYSSLAAIFYSTNAFRIHIM